MESEEFYSWGQLIHVDELTIPAVQVLADAISSFPFATLLGLRREDDWEGVEVEFDVQMPQKPPVPILGRERLVIAFGADEDEDDLYVRILGIVPGIPEPALLRITIDGDD